MSCGTEKLLVTIRVKVELTLELVDELKPKAAKGSDPPQLEKLRNLEDKLHYAPRRIME